MLRKGLKERPRVRAESLRTPGDHRENFGSKLAPLFFTDTPDAGKVFLSARSPQA
jgi:hypothetical protein